MLGVLSSDEGLIRIEIGSKTSGSTRGGTLMVETFSGNNWYYWHPIEISSGHTQHSFSKNTYHLTIQRIRHNGDRMHIYFAPLNGLTIEVKSVKVTAFVLERK